MKKIALIIVFSVMCLGFIFANNLYAQVFPSTQGAGAIEESVQQEKKSKEAVEQLETPRKKADIEQEQPPEEGAIAPGEKFTVKTIIVTGSTLLDEKEIREIVAPYENKEISLVELREVTDKITALYRKKGYITSMSFIPPQKIDKETVEIRVVEGKMGDIEVSGNRYYKAANYKNKIRLKKGEIFDYNIFQRCVQYINEHSGRSVKGVMKAGKQPGDTDILLVAKEQFPMHADLTYDNFGSRFTGYSRYGVQVRHDNATGHDDIFSFQYQLSDANRYRLLEPSYTFPFDYGGKAGISFSDTYVNLGKDYEDSDAVSKGQVYNLFYSHPAVRKDWIDVNINAGFEYKDTENYFAEVLSSRDYLRIFKIGADFDFTDKWGRTLLTSEMRFGVPDIMHGDPNKYNNSALFSSREGRRNKFNKLNLYLARVCRLPYDSNLLLRFSQQITPQIMPAAEQFLIGGSENVRGYPRAEYGGDEGTTASAEISTPFYFMPKKLKVPGCEKSFYDASRFAMFFDWGRIRNYRSGAGVNKNYYLAGAGAGIRFNPRDDFYVRMDIAAPVNIKPSNNSKTTFYIEAKKTF